MSEGFYFLWEIDYENGGAGSGIEQVPFLPYRQSGGRPNNNRNKASEHSCMQYQEGSGALSHSDFYRVVRASFLPHVCRGCLVCNRDSSECCAPQVNETERDGSSLLIAICTKTTSHSALLIQGGAPARCFTLDMFQPSGETHSLPTLVTMFPLPPLRTQHIISNTDIYPPGNCFLSFLLLKYIAGAHLPKVWFSLKFIWYMFI